VMTPDPDCAPSWLTVDAFAAGLTPARQHRSYPLLDIDGRVMALVTLSQLTHVRPGERATTRLIDVATPLARVTTAQPQEPLVEVLGRRAATVAKLPVLVLADNRLVGILTHTDVTRAGLQATRKPRAPHEASPRSPSAGSRSGCQSHRHVSGRPAESGEGSDAGRRTCRFSLPHPADKC
jgi:CBS-domain-containing membrane protein